MQMKLVLLAAVAFLLCNSSDGRKHKDAISKIEKNKWNHIIKGCYKKSGVTEAFIDSLYDTYFEGMVRPREENCFFACYHETVGTFDRKTGKYQHLELAYNVLPKENKGLVDECVERTKNVHDPCSRAYMAEMCYTNRRGE